MIETVGFMTLVVIMLVAAGILYMSVRRTHQTGQLLDRKTAEQVARRDTHDRE